MVVLGVIPARGGSKSIPRKNIAPLAGRPLLWYTCTAALRSERLTRTIVSTDDEEIRRVGEGFGVDGPFLRPAALADDRTPMVDVLRHALIWIEASERLRVDAVVLLQPTSPLRRREDIDRAVDLFVETGAETVVSVTEVPHQFNPVSVMRIEEGRLIPFVSGPMLLRRQDKPRLYARNGPAVLVVRRDVVVAGNLYGADCRPYIMGAEDSVDIDNLVDLKLAEVLLTERQRRGEA